MGLKVIACFQARMGSTRLPGKILKKIGDKTVFEYIVDRLKHCSELDDIVLATSYLDRDQALVDMAKQVGIKYHTGPEEDVVTRLMGAGQENSADAVVRILGDCPFVDPKLVDKAVSLFRHSYPEIDMVNNFHPPTFPDGLDVDVTAVSALEKINNTLPPDDFYRAWWLSYMFENPDHFKVSCFKHPENLVDIRLTLDQQEDLDLIREIHDHFARKGRELFHLEDIMELLDEKPELLDINKQHIDADVVDGVRSVAYHSLKPKK
ncbi:MAG: glycosyltransferase family protein [Patescibacteria group bacterium]|nr:glycosyltransferase family protein [Patescibacteria group bacterium]